ncbi:drug resistance transporter, EmrB/QacA subfamily [Micromonospora nigra]|uniref:Drug resistance transporter, EmrB/QacA subfamily n=1 Tax=Micromonospora nigra TaxID=145857 RepID=A0A1C6SY32_9ACTN|nr:MFS transporter [Micromonospora nigra]SCL34466.1 drug resistance transporter, EmrB/QacA subfamily [Micromonospora nigra]
MSTVNSSRASEGAGGPRADAPRPEPDPRRWWALTLLCGLQFMILLDMTIVNVALPRIQDSLGFSESGLAWVVNGYVLMAGGLLLLGGRLADFFGRRRLLLAGVVIFAISSAVCGAAVNQSMMVAGRFGQGIAEALAAPASLGMIALLFTDPKERTKALGIWGGLVALGGTLGYVISGLLTDLASWRWIFYINLPVALVVFLLLPRLVAESKMVRQKGETLDVAGAVTSTSGLVAIVYGLLQAAENPWGSASVVVPLLVGVALLLAMLIIERRAKNPLIPLNFFANRTRSVINVASLFYMAAFISYTFMLTLYEQHVLGYSPLKSGLAWLPLGFAIGAGIGLGTALTPKLGVKLVAALGFIGAGVGLFLTSMIDTDSAYLTGLLPGMIVFGLFAGATMPAATNAALHGVTVQDSGLASGVQTTMQQVGSALGLAVLVTLALRHAGDEMMNGVAPEVAVTAGYALAFRVGAGLMLFGGVLILALFERVSTELRDPTAEMLEKAAH